MKTTRLGNIELTRMIAAFMVVVIHIDACYTPLIVPFTRWAIPFFFMVSGYFLGAEGKTVDWRKHIGRTALLFLFSTALYACIACIKACMAGTPVFVNTPGYILSRLLLLGANPFGYHLWYISSFLYVLILAAVIDRFHLWKYAFLLIVPLLIGRFVLNVEGSPYLTRNFLFVGLPCFLSGACIRRYNEWLQRVPTAFWAAACVLLFAGQGIEYHSLACCKIVLADVVCAYPLAACLLVWLNRLPQLQSRYIVTCAGTVSMLIYILHPMVDWLFQLSLSGRVLEVYTTWLTPVVTFLASWLLADLLLRLWNAVTHRKKA